MASTTLIPSKTTSICSSIPILNPSTSVSWELKRHQDANSVVHRASGQAFRVLANPNVSPGKDGSNEVIMVDPLEAKRLAAKQMKQIKAKEKWKRRRQIEAINGAWAMIGLTVGIIIEGHTGKSILSQLAGYWKAVVHFFLQRVPLLEGPGNDGIVFV